MGARLRPARVTLPAKALAQVAAAAMRDPAASAYFVGWCESRDLNPERMRVVVTAAHLEPEEAPPNPAPKPGPAGVESPRDVRRPNQGAPRPPRAHS